MWWYEENNRVNLKDEKVVVKLINPNGTFKQSAIIPTNYFPLNSLKYEVFNYANTVQVVDSKILKIFDSIKYKVGQCYSNTEKLAEKLLAAHYDVKTYVGWVFTSACDIPAHHCWCLVNDCFLLDLSDDYTQMFYGSNGENFQRAKTIDEQRQLMSQFRDAAARVPNSTRCYPVGKATPFLLYIGAECSPAEGVKIYQNLMRDYPQHDAAGPKNDWLASVQLGTRKQ